MGWRYACFWRFCFTAQEQAYALEKEEAEQLQAEIARIENEDPELARAMKEELKEAVAKGEIELPAREDGDRGRQGGREQDRDKMEKEFLELIKSGKLPKDAERIMHEKYGGPPEGDFDKPDLRTPEGKAEALERFSGEKENLLKEGFTKEEIAEIEEKIKAGEDPREIFERHDFEKGPGDFDRGPRDFERGGREMSEKEMREMGREPTDKEREMMEREGMERGEREGFERDEREVRERDERIREDGPPPSP